MKLPDTRDTLKAFIIALILAILGLFLFPLSVLSDPRIAFSVALGLGAFLGAVLIRIEFAATARPSAASGETVTLFVGNLAFKTSPEELRELFRPFGTLHTVRIMKDRTTRRPRGFAFVELDRAQGEKAIQALNGKEFHGRTLRVNTSDKPRQSAP